MLLGAVVMSGLATLVLVLGLSAAGSAGAAARLCRPRAHADLRGCDFRAADLKHASLRGSDLTGDDLAFADLVGADLRGASLIRANLSHANLAQASINDADFRGARFQSLHADRLSGRASLPFSWSERYGLLLGPTADLRGEDLESLPLDGLDLAAADLSRAKLRGSSVTKTDLVGANLSDVEADAVDASETDLARADLKASSWRAADLADATLSGADLRSADFAHAVLLGANVSGSRLAEANLANVSTGGLQGVAASLPAGWAQVHGYLVGSQAELGDSQLQGRNLAGADLVAATLPNADLQGADLRSNTLASSDLLDTNLVGSSLSAQSLKNAAIQGSRFADANITGTSGTPVQGAPRSLPGGWAVANQQLVQVPSDVPSGTDFNDGQWIESPNGEFTVNMQTDGNLVEYEGGTAIWATGTSGADQTVMQTDCNLVIYRAGQFGQPAGAIYTTGTGGDPTGNCSFAIADDGSLTVVTSDGTVRWERYANGTLYTHRIHMTENAPMFSSPSASSSEVGTIPNGDSPDYVCWTTGPAVGNVNVYFYVLWQGVAGYYPSYYDSSVYATDSRISIDYGIPACGSVPTTFTPPSNGSVVLPGPSTIAAPIEVFTQTGLYPGPSSDSGAALAEMPATRILAFYAGRPAKLSTG